MITAVESNLATEALQINAHLRRRRSTPQLSGEDSNKVNYTSNDANENLFANLFNFTRPQRDADNKDEKIPLDGLVQAVESTLINSAENLQDSKPISNDENATNGSTTEIDASHRINRDASSENDKNNESDSRKDSIVQVQKLDSANFNQNLNILSPITFKSHVNETSTTSDELPATTEQPTLHKTNVTVIQASKSVSLIPATENKVAHVQHQAISETVFQSSLAIFPNIPSMNTPVQFTTTAEDLAETTIIEQANHLPNNSEKDAKIDELQQNADKLMEKYQEVQAEPVILSQF